MKTLPYLSIRCPTGRRSTCGLQLVVAPLSRTNAVATYLPSGDVRSDLIVTLLGIGSQPAQRNNAKMEMTHLIGSGRLDLMADGAHRVIACRVEKSGVIAVHVIAGCPDGQSRKNVLARGGVCVLINQLNTNRQPHHANYYTLPRPRCPPPTHHVSPSWRSPRLGVSLPFCRVRFGIHWMESVQTHSQSSGLLVHGRNEPYPASDGQSLAGGTGSAQSKGTMGRDALRPPQRSRSELAEPAPWSKAIASISTLGNGPPSNTTSAILNSATGLRVIRAGRLVQLWVYLLAPRARFNLQSGFNR